MAHPQTSPRGYIAKKRINIGSQEITYNSTGLILSEGIKISNQTYGVVTALSTGIVVTAVKIGDHWLTANSTGILIGAAQISTA